MLFREARPESPSLGVVLQKMKRGVTTAHKDKPPMTEMDTMKMIRRIMEKETTHTMIMVVPAVAAVEVVRDRFCRWLCFLLKCSGTLGPLAYLATKLILQSPHRCEFLPRHLATFIMRIWVNVLLISW